MHGSSRFLVVLAILVAPISTVAQSPAETAAATARRTGRVPPTAAAVRTVTAPTIDAKLDDAAWARLSKGRFQMSSDTITLAH